MFFELLLKLESKILNIIGVKSYIKNIDDNDNKLKYQQLISEKINSIELDKNSNSISLKNSDLNITNVNFCNNYSFRTEDQKLTNIENIAKTGADILEVGIKERSDILLNNLFSKLRYTNENFCFKNGEKSNESIRNTFCRFYNSGLYNICHMIINKLIAREDKNCHYLHAKGAVYFKQNKILHAIMTFVKINKIDKNYKYHYTIFAQCYYISEYYEKANEYIALELEHNPGNYLCKILKEKIFIKNNKFSKALKLLEVCEKMHFMTELTHYEKAKIYFKLRNFKDAIQHFYKLANKNYNIAEYHIMVIKCLMWQDENIEAEVYLSKLLMVAKLKMR